MRRLYAYILLAGITLAPLSATASRWETNLLHVTHNVWAEAVPAPRISLASSGTNGLSFAYGSYVSPMTIPLAPQRQIFWGTATPELDVQLELVAEFPFEFGDPITISSTMADDGTPYIAYFKDITRQLPDSSFMPDPSIIDFGLMETKSTESQVGRILRPHPVIATRKPGTTNWWEDILFIPIDPGFIPQEPMADMLEIATQSNQLVAALGLYTPKPIIAFQHTSPEGKYHCAQVSPEDVTPRPPLRLLLLPNSVPLIAYGIEDGIMLSYPDASGNWQHELISTNAAENFDLAYSQDGQLGIAFRDGTSVVYGRRGTFGSWYFETLFPADGGLVALHYNSNNLPAITFSQADIVYYASRTTAGAWQIETIVNDPRNDMYSSEKHANSTLALTHHSKTGIPLVFLNRVSRNRTVNTQWDSLMLSHLPNRIMRHDWALHAKDVSWMDTRPVYPLPNWEPHMYAIEKTIFTEHEDVKLSVLTDYKHFQEQGQLWVHWWNGSESLWLRMTHQTAYTNHNPALSRWECTIPAGQTGIGMNYYAIQLKVIQPLPFGEEEITEHWLTRDLTGDATATHNNLRQAISELGYLHHDWPVTIVADTDADGIPDAWEITHNLDPENPADAALDSDGDGMSNYAEYIAGTDPEDSLSFLHFENIVVTENEMTFCVAVGAERLVAIERSIDLTNPTAWHPYGIRYPHSGASTFSLTYITHPQFPFPSPSFYRVRAHLP